MKTSSHLAVSRQFLGALSLSCAAALPAYAAIPATPLITEIFVNKNGVLGLAWSPVVNAASVRVQVQTTGAQSFCKLDATKPVGCVVNQAVALNGPLAPALNTGISVAAYNSGNVFVRLAAVDSTGKNWSYTSWIAAPHYLGLTSGGKAWPPAQIPADAPLTVTASVSNSTATTGVWAFDVQGNLSNKSRSGLNFTVTPMTTGSQQIWVLKSRSGGMTIDTGVVKVIKINPVGIVPGPNTYAKFGLVVPNNYHAGSDYIVAEGSPVRSVSSGFATTIPMPQGGTVDNHCMGNVIMVSSNSGKYYLYAHLQEISIKNGAYIAVGAQIGKVGRTGYDNNARLSCRLTKAPAHLHIELKNSPILHNPVGNDKVWGYTPQHPDGFGYSNPE